MELPASALATKSDPSKPRPKNIGTRWKPEDDAWLLNAITTQDFPDCARHLERTRGAIVARLCLHAASRLVADSTLTLADVAPALKVSAYSDRIQKIVAKIASGTMRAIGTL
jgi:hypothetical protein